MPTGTTKENSGSESYKFEFNWLSKNLQIQGEYLKKIKERILLESEIHSHRKDFFSDVCIFLPAKKSTTPVAININKNRQSHHA